MLSVQQNSGVLEAVQDEQNWDAAPRRGFPFWLLPLVASWGYGVWLYGRLPATVPVHWNLAGEVDRYGGRAEAAFLFPALFVLIAALMLGILPRFIPNTAEYVGTRRVYDQLVGVVLALMLYVQVVIAQLFMGREVHLISLLTLGAGVMFILMGNLLPKLRRNPIAGVRLSWALRDDTVWVKSQRMGGLAFVILGLVLVCAAPLPGVLPMAVLLVGKLLAVAVTVWYAWRISRDVQTTA
jgi:uncharacterized membrane protein